MRRNDKEDFFSVLLLRVLERARKALEVLPLASTEVESGVAKLKALCDNGERKIVVSSVAGVMRALGGKQSVAARVFMSVMDDDEKGEFEALSQEATKRTKVQVAWELQRVLQPMAFDRVTSFVEELRQIGVPKRLLSDAQVRTARFLASVLRVPPSVAQRRRQEVEKPARLVFMKKDSDDEEEEEEEEEDSTKRCFILNKNTGERCHETGELHKMCLYHFKASRSSALTLKRTWLCASEHQGVGKA